MSKQAEIPNDRSVSSGAHSGKPESCSNGLAESCNKPAAEFEEFELDDIEEIESKVFA